MADHTVPAFVAAGTLPAYFPAHLVQLHWSEFVLKSLNPHGHLIYWTHGFACLANASSSWQP